MNMHAEVDDEKSRQRIHKNYKNIRNEPCCINLNECVNISEVKQLQMKNDIEMV